MPDGRERLAVEVVGRIDDLPAGDWDACAGAGDPFLLHAFLSALEASGSVGRDSGWVPRHLAFHGPDGRLAAVAPLYIKTHSYGEYVFDWGWAEAYERAGGRYYPKLQCSVPFTPVTGRRLLVRAGQDAREARAVLAGAMIELAGKSGLSSVHATFCDKAEDESFQALGFLERLGLQYHWTNRDYGSFDHFLAGLASRKRKNIRKERAQVAAAGIRFQRLRGDDITPRHWDLFDGFYRATSDRKWGVPYLNRAFWEILAADLADRVLLIFALQEGREIAAALNFIGNDALFGRNWGCSETHRFLHFETCFYQAIDFAIENGLGRVEAGAQGEHKIQRGYLPVETYSYHWIADGGFRDAVAHFLSRERQAIARDGEYLAALGPFRRDG